MQSSEFIEIRELPVNHTFEMVKLKNNDAVNMTRNQIYETETGILRENASNLFEGIVEKLVEEEEAKRTIIDVIFSYFIWIFGLIILSYILVEVITAFVVKILTSL